MVAIVTGFFSVLGMAIERFHMFAVVRDYSAIKRKFSIIWFLSSWTLSIVFVIILLPQIRDQVTCSHDHMTAILISHWFRILPSSTSSAASRPPPSWSTLQHLTSSQAK